jgi:hypothetical protein
MMEEDLWVYSFWMVAAMVRCGVCCIGCSGLFFFFPARRPVVIATVCRVFQTRRLLFCGVALGKHNDGQFELNWRGG